MCNDVTSNDVINEEIEFSERARGVIAGHMVLAEHDMLDHILRLAEREGGYRALAGKLGVSVSYLSDVMHGRREVSAQLAMKLGKKRICIFLEAK